MFLGASLRWIDSRMLAAYRCARPDVVILGDFCLQIYLYFPVY